MAKSMLLMISHSTDTQKTLIHMPYPPQQAAAVITSAGENPLSLFYIIFPQLIFHFPNQIVTARSAPL
jgi:hypothetical protein